MSSDANKRRVAAFYDAINRGAFDELAQVCHDDLGFFHRVDTPHVGVAGFVASEKRNFDAFSNCRLCIQDMVATDDKVRPTSSSKATTQANGRASRPPDGGCASPGSCG